MLKKTITIALLFLFLTPMPIMAQGDKEEEAAEKVEKVTSASLEGEAQDDSTKKETEKDLAAITSEVEKSTVPTVIKAVSLAVIIFGLAYAYYPKKKKEVPNG
ncbi:MAG: hypothetical protein JJE07_13285 [Flavobacteriaceae bacterium]|nr:hypothetical protein [Flavobacteriaceae bacterium]